ncbi:MAG: GIY-YIG nuclease family protein [Campylobacterota bacterium]|nr:GIY-YIG nuclease family protein [Campylobacterota bacterium]
MADIKSLDDIFNDDTFGILDNKDEDNIFTLINVPKVDKDRAATDFVARRTKLENFDKYEEMFIQCQKDLKEGKRKLVKFNESFFEKGAFFVLKGILVYLEDINNLKKDKNHKLDARTTTIFENGTYSNMLLRSLGKGLYDDGYFVSKHEDRLLDDLHQITSEDKQNGFIYILKSLSNEDIIATKKNLFKIGFSTTAVETRIKNAVNDPTYLMADVQTVAAYEVYNVNPHKLEQLIHQFFGNSCLDIDIIDGNGQLHRPREWFIAPLEVIEEAIELIVNGKIVDYQFDKWTDRIVSK